MNAGRGDAGRGDAGLGMAGRGEGLGAGLGAGRGSGIDLALIFGFSPFFVILQVAQNTLGSGRVLLGIPNRLGRLRIYALTARASSRRDGLRSRLFRLA